VWTQISWVALEGHKHTVAPIVDGDKVVLNFTKMIFRARNEELFAGIFKVTA